MQNEFQITAQEPWIGAGYLAPPNHDRRCSLWDGDPALDVGVDLGCLLVGDLPFDELSPGNETFGISKYCGGGVGGGISFPVGSSRMYTSTISPLSRRAIALAHALSEMRTCRFSLPNVDVTEKPILSRGTLARSSANSFWAMSNASYRRTKEVR
jgi:hypothetical protein